MNEPPFHERLNFLFSHALDKEGREFTKAEISRRTKKLGSPLTESYLKLLSKGERIPTIWKVRALADVFNVRNAFFTDSLEVLNEETLKQYRLGNEMYVLARSLKELTQDDRDKLVELLKNEGVDFGDVN